MRKGILVIYFENEQIHLNKEPNSRKNNHYIHKIHK